MNPEDRRKHKRFEAPAKTFAAWKSLGKGTVSRVQNIGLGGLYLAVAEPPATGASIDLVVALPVGDVRARAVVRRSTPGSGMGVQFIQMRAEDRARLNQFLSHATERLHGAPPAATGHATVQAPAQPAPPLEESFRDELAQIVELARKGTYYQLLGVTHDSSGSDLKRKYYALAKKFHPDLHMDKKQVVGTLKDLMEKITEAYQTLKDEQSRTAYDQKLATAGAFNLERSKTESQLTVEECMSRAQECLRAKNFVGSITWLRKCVDVAPNSGKHHALLARSLGAVHAYKDEAIYHFERAIGLDPWNTEAYYYFGEFYETLHLPWRAQLLYAKILDMNPEHVKARLKMQEQHSKGKSGKDHPKAAPIPSERRESHTT